MPILLVIAYPILVHISILTQANWLQTLALIGLATSLLYPGLKQNNYWVFMIWSLCISLAMCMGYFGYAFTALFIPPIVFNAAVGYFFARTLTAGRTPLVTDIAQQIRNETPPAVVRYTTVVTWAWAILLFSLAFINALLPLMASLDVWSWFSNFLNYLIIGLAFVIEFLLRYVFLRHVDHPTFKEFCIGLSKVNWKKLF